MINFNKVITGKKKNNNKEARHGLKVQIRVHST